MKLHIYDSWNYSNAFSKLLNYIPVLETFAGEINSNDRELHFIFIRNAILGNKSGRDSNKSKLFVSVL